MFFLLLASFVGNTRFVLANPAPQDFGFSSLLLDGSELNVFSLDPPTDGSNSISDPSFWTDFSSSKLEPPQIVSEGLESPIHANTYVEEIPCPPQINGKLRIRDPDQMNGGVCRKRKPPGDQLQQRPTQKPVEPQKAPTNTFMSPEETIRFNLDQILLRGWNNDLLDTDPKKCQQSPYWIHICCEGPVPPMSLSGVYSYAAGCDSIYPNSHCGSAPYDLCCIAYSADPFPGIGIDCIKHKPGAAEPVKIPSL